MKPVLKTRIEAGDALFQQIRKFESNSSVWTDSKMKDEYISTVRRFIMVVHGKRSSDVCSLSDRSIIYREVASTYRRLGLMKIGKASL